MKDNFSNQAKQYAQYRPSYPEVLVENLSKLCSVHQLAWDCATGNGQMAKLLVDHFDQVYATDISQKQLGKASSHPKIEFHLEAAENTQIKDESVDLITVAQAAHWFDLPAFYQEAKRVLKPKGIIALITYPLLQTTHPIQDVIQDFYHNITGPYWDPERKLVETAYQNIPFPFQEINFPIIKVDQAWNAQQLLGYFSTWSAVQHYIKKNGQDPLNLVQDQVKNLLPNNDEFNFHWQMLARVGRKL